MRASSALHSQSLNTGTLIKLNLETSEAGTAPLSNLLSSFVMRLMVEIITRE